MRKIIYTIAFAVLALLPAISYSQSVQVLISQRVANLPTTATSYLDDPFKYFTVQFMVTGVGAAGIDVYIDMNFGITTASEGTFSLSTRPNTYPAEPIHLREGINILDKETATNQLRGGRLNQQIDMSNPLLSQQLPEGQYQICLTAYRWSDRANNNRTELTSNCHNFNICYSGSAPELVSPLAGAQLGLNGMYVLTPTRKLTFRWTSVISNCAGSHARFKYSLKVVKVLPSQNYQDAIRLNPPVFSTIVNNNTFVVLDTLLDSKIQLERGALYVAQVSAEQIMTNSGEPMILSNDGKSQLSTFFWGEEGDVIPNHDDDGEDDNGDDNDDGDGVSDNDEDNGHTTFTVKSRVINTRDAVVANAKAHYIVDWGLDSNALFHLYQQFPKERVHTPKSSYGFNRVDGFYMVPDSVAMKIAFMPVRFDSMYSAIYELDLFEFVGSVQNSQTRPAIKHKELHLNDNVIKGKSQAYDTIQVDLSEWKKTLESGQRYYLRLHSVSQYAYSEFHIQDTTFYVNNIAANTVHDTVITKRPLEAVIYDNGITFQWGIDSSLFEQVTPAQFTFPVDLSQADISDTSFSVLPKSIPSAVKTETFNIRWKAAEGLVYGDTAIYYITVKELKDKQTLAGAWKSNDTVVHDTVRFVNNIDCEDTAFYNKLATDKKYIIHIQTAIDQKSDAEYHFAGGTGGSGLKAVFKLEKELEVGDELTSTVSCFAKDTVGLNRKELLKINADTMVNQDIPVHLGRFELHMQKATFDSKKNTYKGEGFVMWSPIPNVRFGVKVSFGDLKINKDTIAFEGYAKSMNVDTLGYINLSGYNDTNKYLADFDAASGYAHQNMNFIAGQMGEYSKDVKKYYEKINKSANIINSVMQSKNKGGKLNVGVFPTPLKLGGDLLGTNSDNLTLQVNNMYFTPTTALMSIVGVWAQPSDHVYIPVLATNICTEPTHFISDSVQEVNIIMPKDYDIELPNGHIFRFKAPSDFSKLEDGCYVKFDKKNKYQNFTIDVEYEFGKSNDPTNKLLAIDINTGKVKQGRAVCGRLRTSLINWKEWVASIHIDPFTVVGMDDYMFVPTGKGVFYDHSESYTPPQLKFPKDFKYKDQNVDDWLSENAVRNDKAYKKWLDTNVAEELRPKMLKEYQDFFEQHPKEKGNPGIFQGFYIDQFALFMPTAVSNTFSDKDTATHKQDSAFYINYTGVNNEVKGDTVWYIIDDYRMQISAQNLIIDEYGITASINAINLVDAETRKGGGWAFSLDTVGITVMQSHFKDAHICGTMAIPLFKERMKYKCAIGSEDLVFNITHKDKLTLEAFSIKMKLDKSSHFNITHRYKPDDGDPATLFDLTLNGVLGIETGDDAINMSGVKFENFWIRNFADLETKQALFNSMPGHDTVTGNRIDEYLRRGAAKDKLMTMGGTFINLGTWSKASPQKSLGKYSNYREVEEWERQQGMTDALVPDEKKEGKGDGSEKKKGDLGGFSFNLSTFEIFCDNSTGDAVLDQQGYRKYGIDFAGSIAFDVGDKAKINAGAGFKLMADLNIGEGFKYCNAEARLDSIHVKADMYKFAVDAKLFHTDDSIYGYSWAGYAKVTVVEALEVGMAIGFGTSRELSATKLRQPEIYDTVYSWWYFEGAAVLSKGGIPLGPVTLKGFGGGFAYNMELKQSCRNVTPTQMRNAGKGKNLVDGMVANTGLEFKPSQDSWVAKAGIALYVGDETACDMTGILTLRVADGHFSGISLMVNAKILAHYDEKADSTSLATINIAAFVDYTNDTAFGQFAFSAAVEGGMNLKSFLDSSDAVTATIKNNIKAKTESGPNEGLSKLAQFVSPSSQGQKMKQEKSMADKKDEAELKKAVDSIYAAQSGNIGGSLNLNIPIELYVRNYKDNRISPHTGEKSEWYFAIGMPAKDKRATFGLEADLVVTKCKVLMSMYFMFGNYFPDSISIPALPSEVQEFLGKDYKPSNGRSFTNFGQGGGFAMGLSVAANLKINMALYVDVSAYFGFDAALQKTNGKSCNGHPMGKNGYYAQGQVYAMLKGDVGLGLDLGFWEGHVSLAKAGLGAVLQGGGPNPTWAYGLVKFEAELLGGLCKINTNFDFQLGNVCIEGAGNPMANVKLFQGVSPAYTPYNYSQEDNVVSPLARGVIVSNMPWNTPLTLSVPKTDGIDADERMFKFMMLTPGMPVYSNLWYQRRNTTVKSPSAATFIRTNFGTPTDMKFTQSDDDPNIYYFEDRSGYFTDGSTYQVHLVGVAMEYRPYATNATYTFKHKGQAKSDDYVIDLTKADKHSNSIQKNSLAWRDPLYEHDGKKTVKEYEADTTFFFNTGGLPNTLDNQVVFTWPYNGDPMVPYNNFPMDAGKPYVTIAMKVQRNDIFNAQQLQALNKRLKVFMLRKGDGNNAAEECEYAYLSNGINNNGVPTLKVYIPSKFAGTYAREQAFSVQVMTITDDSYATIMARMAKEAEKIAAKTRVTYEQQNGRNVKTIKGGNGSDDLAQQQQQVLKDAYAGMTADTLLNVKRKELTEYDIFDQGGEKIYTLYYHVSEKPTYKDMLSNYLPDATQSTNNYTYSGGCLTVRGNYNDYAYLFEAWKPNNSKLYATDVTLPAICHLVIDPVATANENNEILIRHRRMTMRLIDLDKSIKKLTYVYTMPDWQPVSELLYDNSFWHNFGLTLSNQLSSSYDWNTINEVLSGGLMRNDPAVNMPNAAYRMDYNTWKVTNATKATRYNATNVSFDMLKSSARSSGDTIWGMPAFISVKSTIAKTRIDSAMFYNNTKYKKNYVSGIGYCYKNLGNNSTTFSFVDYATPAMINDIGSMHQFFTDLYDYSYSIMCMRMKTRADNLKNFYKPGKPYTKHNFGHGFAYTVPEVAVYSAYYHAFNWSYRYYWVNRKESTNLNNSIRERATYQEQMYKPLTHYTRETTRVNNTAYGEKVTVWFKNFILFDQYPPTVENYQGMLTTRAFSLYTQKSGNWNIASFYGGLVSKVTYNSKGYDGMTRDWNANSNATWKLRMWYASIDNSTEGVKMLSNMIQRVKNAAGTNTPVIMVNTLIDNKHSTYKTKPYYVNAYLNTKRRIQNKTNYGYDYMNNWRNAHPTEKSANTQEVFNTQNK